MDRPALLDGKTWRNIGVHNYAQCQGETHFKTAAPAAKCITPLPAKCELLAFDPPQTKTEPLHCGGSPVRAAQVRKRYAQNQRSRDTHHAAETVAERLSNGCATLPQRFYNASELIASTARIHWPGVGFGAGAVPRKPRGFILETHTEPSRFLQPARAETQAEPRPLHRCLVLT